MNPKEFENLFSSIMWREPRNLERFAVNALVHQMIQYGDGPLELEDDLPEEIKSLDWGLTKRRVVNPRIVKNAQGIWEPTFDKIIYTYTYDDQTLVLVSDFDDFAFPDFPIATSRRACLKQICQEPTYIGYCGEYGETTILEAFASIDR